MQTANTKRTVLGDGTAVAALDCSCFDLGETELETTFPFLIFITMGAEGFKFPLIWKEKRLRTKVYEP